MQGLLGLLDTLQHTQVCVGELDAAPSLGSHHLLLICSLHWSQHQGSASTPCLTSDLQETALKETEV